MMHALPLPHISCALRRGYWLLAQARQSAMVHCRRHTNKGHAIALAINCLLDLRGG